MCSRSIEYIVSILAVLKSGAAYCPIDPKLPDERVEFMLSDTDAPGVLVAKAYGDRAKPIAEKLGIAMCTVAGSDAEFSIPANFAKKTNSPKPSGSVDRLAYVIYTSGSTGTPKGVLINHRTVHNLILGKRTWHKRDATSIVGNMLGVGFDANVLDTFCALCNGSTLVLVNNLDFTSVVEANGINELVMTPSMLSSIDPSTCTSIRVVTTGGEAMPQSIVDTWAPRLDQLINEYGPTECTVAALYKILSAGDAVTLGKPLVNVKCHVMSPSFNVLPIGAPGELMISGKQVGVSYLKRPERQSRLLSPSKAVSACTEQAISSD